MTDEPVAKLKRQIAYLVQELKDARNANHKLHEELDKAHEEIEGVKQDYSVLRDKLRSLGHDW